MTERGIPDWTTQTAAPPKSRLILDNICLRNTKLDRLLLTFSINKKGMQILEFSLVTVKVLSLTFGRKNSNKQTTKTPQTTSDIDYTYNMALFLPVRHTSSDCWSSVSLNQICHWWIKGIYKHHRTLQTQLCLQRGNYLPWGHTEALPASHCDPWNRKLHYVRIVFYFWALAVEYAAWWLLHKTSKILLPSISEVTSALYNKLTNNLADHDNLNQCL